jgi:hypothetical protein
MLSYEIIVKYLMPEINEFSQLPTIQMNSKDFPYFKNLFDDTFFRFGVNSNNSLKNSLAYCLDVNSDDIISDLHLLVKELHINIIIFDFKNNKIKSEYFGDFFNPWRPTIFLANYNDWYEPIVTKESKLFSFSSVKSHILKNNILNQTIYNNKNEQMIINDNFNEIIEIEGYYDTNDNHDNNDNINAFIKIDIPNKNKLEKMKKDELISLCTNLNKVINISKPTKKDLIDIICKE